MKLGLSSYTYTWAVGIDSQLPRKPMTAFGLIQKAIELNIQLVQIADNLPLDQLTEEEQHQLFTYAKSRGIEIEVGSRGLTIEHTFRYIKLAERFRSPILRMVIDCQGYTPDIDQVVQIISELEPELKKCNVKLAIENHDRLKAYEFENIIQKVGSNFVGICLDSVNSMGAGEGFETVCDKLLPYTINLHVKDFSISRVPHKMGLVIKGTPAGKGMLNIPGLFEKMDQTGHCPSAILELWTPYQSSIKETVALEDSWAKESMHYLKTCI